MQDAFHELVEILSGAPMCFLATVGDDGPHVWPFQFQFEENGRLWFCTSRDKELYKQMEADPRVEICAVMKDTRSVRFAGEAILDDNRRVKERILAEQPLIRDIYGGPDNMGFTSFCLEHGRYSFFDLLGNEPREGAL